MFLSIPSILCYNNIINRWEGVPMIEQRLDRLEDMMEQLIRMTAETNAIVKKTEQRMDGIEQRMDGIEQRMDDIEQHFAEEKKLNAARHQEILKELRYSNIEIEYLRNQSAKHDMEIYVLKQE